VFGYESTEEKSAIDETLIKNGKNVRSTFELGQTLRPVFWARGCLPLTSTG